jgi:type 1 fimbriae regulatory protein FimE
MRDHNNQTTVDLFEREPEASALKGTGETICFPVRGRPPGRRYSDVRSREYLTPDEVERLMRAARSVGRHRHRDAALILIGYRHGLRVSELVSLRWDQIDLMASRIHVTRLKNGSPSVHPLRGPELRALRRLKREYPASPYVFNTERKGPLTASTVRRLDCQGGARR